MSNFYLGQIWSMTARFSLINKIRAVIDRAYSGKEVIVYLSYA